MSAAELTSLYIGDGPAGAGIIASWSDQGVLGPAIHVAEAYFWKRGGTEVQALRTNVKAPLHADLGVSANELADSSARAWLDGLAWAELPLAGRFSDALTAVSDNASRLSVLLREAVARRELVTCINQKTQSNELKELCRRALEFASLVKNDTL